MNTTRTKGFSIIEFMIAITLSLLVLAALSTAFVGSSRSREEMERANQQVENGRYAVQVMNDDFQHAGYMSYLDQYCAACSGLNLFGGYSCTSSPCAPVTWSNSPALPDPCATDVTALRVAMPLHVQGYDNGASAPSCITDLKAGTDVVVLRRASTCAAGSANCALQTGAPYFQASTCNSNTELSSTTTYDPADETTHSRYRLNTDQSKLVLHKKDCATAADKLRYLVRIYYVANNDQGADGIPTLKMAELDMGTNGNCPSRPPSPNTNWCIMPIAEGVENLQIEYGVDHSPTVGDGSPDTYTADPSRFNPASPGTLAADCASNSKCVTNWQNVMAIRLNLLVRSTTKSKSFIDSKAYQLGLKADGTANTVPAQNDAYRRHVYESSIWLINVAGRRAA